MDPVDIVERRFYLEHFRGRSLIVAEGAGGSADPVVDVSAALDALVADGARVIHLHHERAAPPLPADEGFIAESWAQLRRTGLLRLAIGDADPLAVGTRLACRLRPFKLVLLDPAAAVHADRPPPFEVLGGQAEDEDGTRHLAGLALDVGVGSVNVCRPADVAEELLTYHGAGVLYTREDYCHVERLRLDDYEAAGRLIEQGVAEGYLLPRDAGGVAQLLLHGYGARFGDDHLAGFAALLVGPYREDALGEVSALTTISRFTGGGVGGMIVRRMLDDARLAGLQGVFACTTSDRAAAFFSALGFQRVPADELPAGKWDAYDRRRRRQLIALLHRLP